MLELIHRVGVFHTHFFSMFKVLVIHATALLLEFCEMLSKFYEQRVFSVLIEYEVWDSTAGFFPEKREEITSGLWIRGFFPKLCISLLFPFLKHLPDRGVMKLS